MTENKKQKNNILTEMKNLLITNSKGNISWKQTAINIFTIFMNRTKYTESEYICPLCESILLESDSEFFCSNENCKFDKTFDELVFFYAEHNNLERSE